MEPGRELTTWKAIAAHLGVHLRTAQTWEAHRGLPVRRLPGGRGRVTTTTEELDQWRRGSESMPVTETVPSYRWPLGHGITAEIRFLGTPVMAAHLEVLRQYLDVAKNALDCSTTKQ
jgi:hypothetical protein